VHSAKPASDDSRGAGGTFLATSAAPPSFCDHRRYLVEGSRAALRNPGRLSSNWAL